MSSSALFSIGTRAMTANYAALQTTGHNIANANTEGYTRQEVELATAGGQFSGAGFFGKGVDVKNVARVHDQFLTREASLTQSVASADEARLTQLQQLENLFATGEDGLGYACGQLLNAFVDVASRPLDTASRQVVLGQVEDVAARFRAAGEQMDTMQAGVTQELKVSIDAVNALAGTVAALNSQIAAAKATGHEPNDLLDQRDAAVAEIGRYLQVSTINADDGTQGLFIAGGQRLVLGGQAATLTAMSDPYDPSMVHLGAREGGIDRLVPDSMVGGGSIAGLLRFQNEDLRNARNTVGRMATALASALNAQQAAGVDLNGISGAALFDVGAPSVVSSSRNNSSNPAVFDLQMTDASKLQASDYELRFDGSYYTLTRLGSQDAPQSFTPAQLAAGVSFDGLTLRLTGGTAAARDSFLIQPVAGAAGDMRGVLGDPRGIAAASTTSNNGNALALVALRDALLVDGSTITDAWANALADIGVRVQSAEGAAQLSSSMATDAKARNTATSGVNLDEEAARLIQYQQSYQAAAKMLLVAQAVFDTLLQATTN